MIDKNSTQIVPDLNSTRIGQSSLSFKTIFDPSRHHLPRFYLYFFCKKERRQYNIHSNFKNIFTTQIKNINYIFKAIMKEVIYGFVFFKKKRVM